MVRAARKSKVRTLVARALRRSFLRRSLGPVCLSRVGQMGLYSRPVGDEGLSRLPYGQSELDQPSPRALLRCVLIGDFAGRHLLAYLSSGRFAISARCTESKSACTTVQTSESELLDGTGREWRNISRRRRQRGITANSFLSSVRLLASCLLVFDTRAHPGLTSSTQRRDASASLSTLATWKASTVRT
jgi:hypothetical protein